MRSNGVSEFKDLDQAEAFGRLKGIPAPELEAVLSGDRVSTCSLPAGGGLTYNYGAKAVSDDAVAVLADLAAEQELVAKYKALASGEVMNTGEDRMVLHHLMRGVVADKVVKDGFDYRAAYVAEQRRVAEFAEAVRAGRIVGSTGKRFETFVQIGIGGSDLGPRAMYLAIEGAYDHLPARFISNVDPDDAAAVLQDLDPESTLFVLVSKSGTTQETLTNEAFVIDHMERSGRGIKARKHIVAVTSKTSPLAESADYLDAFFIDDYIGGRYSSTSAVGGVILSLAFGPGIFAEFLDGAHEADVAAMEPEITKNAAMLDAAIGVYERNVLGYPVTAVLPYSQALSRFPAHLQQLDMESNGKSVNRAGGKLRYHTGPVVFGEPGTNGQHSFYQLLHQGTDVIPVQFIGFKESQRNHDLEWGGSTSQTKLNANLAAQIIAFSTGKHADNPNKRFAGGRPSSLIHGDRLTARTLGALLAHFENKVMFQGFLWNLNSFDQEGVQLGKVLAKQILSGDAASPAMAAYARLLGL